MINELITYKVAKPITGNTFVKKIDIIFNYKLVPSDYNFVINGDEDVTSFDTLMAFRSYQRINFKVFRDSLKENILPLWSGLTNNQKKNLTNQGVYPDGTTDGELATILGSNEAVDQLKSTKTNEELIEELDEAIYTFSGITNNNFNFISGITDTKLDIINFTNYTGSTETDLSGINNDIDYLSGQTDTKLNITDFNVYTGNTDTRINNNDVDIDYLSGQTDTKLAITDFNFYSAATTTRLNGIDNNISYLSGQTDTKLNITDFNVYSAATYNIILKENGESQGRNRAFGNNDAFALAFKTNNTNRIFIQADGDIGFGTDSPVGKFTAQGSDPNQEVFVVRGAIGQVDNYFEVRENPSTNLDIFRVEGDGTISTAQANYENKVTNPNDFPNKQYVDDGDFIERYYTENLNQQNTNSSTFQTYLSLTRTVTAGTYEIFVDAHYGNSSTKKTSVLRFNLDGSPLHPSDFGREFSENNLVTDSTIKREIVLTAGSHTINIQYRALNGTAFVSFGAISLVKIS